MKRKVLIIGGGVAGPVLGMFLKRAGHEVRVCEARGAFDTVGGGFQIAPNGMRVLDALGLTEEVEQRGHVGRGFWFLNSHGKTVTRFGIDGRPVMLTRADLHRALLDAAARAGVAVEYGRKLERIEERATEVCAHFADGSAAEAELLVGADGTHSRVRALFLPEAAAARPLGMLGLGGFVDAPGAVDERHVDVISFVMGPNGLFGFGALDAAGRRWGWWSHIPHADASDGQRAAKVDGELARRLLLDRFGDYFGPARTFIGNTPSVLCTAIHDLPPLPRWWRGRVVLVGDAAHAMSPVGGQGVSMAFEDAQLLAAVISSSATLDEALAGFEWSRRRRTEPMVARARKNSERNMKPVGPFGEWFRDQMFGLFGPAMGRALNKEYAASAAAVA
jgi:2-polyprenyl-6-methoxyphenol hydroxylase-like FAD-dependent oxidoreductase